MNRSSLIEETPATPGWVDSRLDEAFAPLGSVAVATREAYASCLAGVRGSVDMDAGHDRCRSRALATLRDLGLDVATLDLTLQALEAEISAGT